jgi:hypothetical protein
LERRFVGRFFYDDVVKGYFIFSKRLVGTQPAAAKKVERFRSLKV